VSFLSPKPRQLPPQPYTSNQTTAPPPWLLPYIQGAAGLNQDILGNRLAGAGAPPTFEDVMGGRFQSGFTGQRPSYNVAGTTDERPPPRPSPGERRGGFDRDGAGIRRMMDTQNSSGSSRPRTPTIDAPRGFGSSEGMTNPRTNRPTGGGRGGAGLGMSGAAQSLAGMMMDRAGAQDPGLAAGSDFITQLLGKDPMDRGGNRWAANPLLNMAGGRARATYSDFTNPNAPINQLIARQMSEGNAASPYQTRFIDELFGRFNAPAPDTNLPIGDRYDLVSQFGASNPLFDPGRYPDAS